MTYFTTIITKFIVWFPSFFSIGVAFFKLPKLETWKDKDAFYVYLEMLINSEFLRLLTLKTPFYLDDLALQKLQVLIKDRNAYDTVYGIFSGVTSLQSLPTNYWDLWNFVNTVLSVRSLLK
jgi:hypothetical protein